MRRVSLPLFALIALTGCLGDAVHDNPLDPDADAYRAEGTVDGTGTGVYPPFEGRAGVRVHLVPLDGGAERVVRTGTGGQFRVEGLPAARYGIHVEADGYRPVDDTVTVAVGAVTRAELRIDALPVVTAQSARTVHMDRWPPAAPVFQLVVNVEAVDPDRQGDVAGATLVAEELAFRAPLVERGPGQFGVTLDASALPGGRVQSLLGRPLRIEVTDRAGNVSFGPPLALVRVVEQTPLTASPQGSVTIAQNPPVLEWRPSDLPFPFTYRVEVSLIDGAGVPNLVAERDDLPPTATTLALGAALPPGDYTWSVWTVDEAGNRSRSKPAGFIVP